MRDYVLFLQPQGGEKKKPITIKDLEFLRDIREWLGLVDRRAVYSCLTGKLIGYVKLTIR